MDYQGNSQIRHLNLHFKLQFLFLFKVVFYHKLFDKVWVEVVTNSLCASKLK